MKTVTGRTTSEKPYWRRRQYGNYTSNVKWL